MWGSTIMSMSDCGIYTWRILQDIYPELRDLALWEGVVDTLMEGTYAMYPYLKFHEYKELVL